MIEKTQLRLEALPRAPDHGSDGLVWLDGHLFVLFVFFAHHYVVCVWVSGSSRGQFICHSETEDGGWMCLSLLPLDSTENWIALANAI